MRLAEERTSPKFKAHEKKYVVHFDEFPEEEETTAFLLRLFRHMLQTFKSKMQCDPNDYLRLNISHPSLDSDISYGFTQCKDLNEDVILKEISTVFFCKRSKRLHEMISGYSQVCQTLLKQSFA